MITVLIFVGTILFGFGIMQRKHYQDYYTKSEYFGVVKRKFLDPYNKNHPSVLIDVNSDTSVYQIPTTEMFNAIESGDIILKKSGTMKHLLIRNKDTFTYFPNNL